MTKKRILGCLRVPPVEYHWFRAFWDVAPTSHVEVYRRFHHQGTCETSVNLNVTTRRYILEDFILTVVRMLNLTE
jgi:hypothetical protein